jgi:hypothetical protein
MRQIPTHRPPSPPPRGPTGSPTTAASASIPGPQAHAGGNAGGGAPAAREPIPVREAPARGDELDRPLGEVPPEGGSQRPGFGWFTTRKLRATETRLADALRERGERPLVNSMHDEKILRKAVAVNTLGLGSVFPMPGMKREMKAILETYNAKYPGLNAKFFNTLEKGMQTACETLQPGETLRGIGIQHGGHAVAMEFRCHRNESISMIALEPMTYVTGIPDALANPRHNPEGRIGAALICGLGIQWDHSSCAGFTKDFLKEMHRHGSHFEQLHRDTRTWLRRPQAAQAQGMLPGVERMAFAPESPVLFLPPEAAPLTLPLPLFKNLQSAERLSAILNTRPSAFTERINARPAPPGSGRTMPGETITERLHRLTGKEWIARNPDTGTFHKEEVPISDKAVPMAENYRRMHAKAAEYGETGRVRPGRGHPPPVGPDRLDP